jgi:hypothetical protein
METPKYELKITDSTGRVRIVDTISRTEMEHVVDLVLGRGLGSENEVES